MPTGKSPKSAVLFRTIVSKLMMARASNSNSAWSGTVFGRLGPKVQFFSPRPASTWNKASILVLILLRSSFIRSVAASLSMNISCSTILSLALVNNLQ